ncbi:MAG: PAS domain S-box protein [Desulfuromonadaceae bacterium]|nr:PAS domain S-box protein [Desulfuromonadaceae bacterium]MDD2855611.1 PAS domain S-box protein [Desulfuromonadaceae bacterium]
MRSVTKYILASIFIAIVTISVFGFYSLDQYHKNEVNNESIKLEMSIRTFWQLLSQKGSDFRILDGRLLVGDYVLNNNFELTDRIQEIFGGVATIFMYDERVSTNILNVEGKRALGVKLEAAIKDTLLKQGRSYRGLVEILDVPYMTAYDPIIDRDGKVVGVLFVGVKEGDLLARMRVIKTKMTLTMATMLMLLTFFMVLVGLATRRIEVLNENQMQFQKTLMDTIPNPVYFKDNASRYLGCNKAFEGYTGFSAEELIGKTPHNLWSNESADLYCKQDLEVLENPGIHSFESSVMYTDGSMRDVIINKAAFNTRDGSVKGLVGVVLDITERKSSERALLFKNILLSTQQEASLDGILVVDENAKILSINQQFIEIMGIPSSLIDAKEDEPVLEYVTSIQADPLQFLEKVKYLYEHRGETCRDEICLTNGKVLDRYTVPLLGVNSEYYGRFWSFRDVTERKAAERDIKAANQQLMEIVEFLPDATFVIDKEKRVVAWNRAIEQMTGIAKGEIIGKGDYLYAIPFYNDSRPLLIDLLDKPQERIDRNYTDIRRDGNVLFAEVFVPAFRNGDSRYFWATATSLYDEQGGVTGGIESIRDITEYKQNEKENSRLESQIEYAHLIETIMTRLGHDLNTPLTPLFILLPIIKSKMTEPDLIKRVDMCIKCINSIKNMADKTRMLAALSSDIKSYQFEDIYLHSIVDKAVARYSENIDKKRLVVQNSIDPALSVHVVPDHFEELFSNLISNAVNFSKTDGTVQIGVERDTERLVIYVRDDGIGLTPEHLESIFSEFFKVDESRHDLDASGLGLAICNRIVRNHNGRIWAESAGIDRGTTIKISI